MVTHECASCGWQGDDDDLVNDVGLTLEEVIEDQGDDVDANEFVFCPNCDTVATQVGY